MDLIEKKDLNNQHGGIGKKFILFLEFLASRQFELLPYIDFSEDFFLKEAISEDYLKENSATSENHFCCFWQKEWIIIHKVISFELKIF